LAGVSASTVSSVLSGNSDHRRISDETHLRVRDAANALGYTPNLLHRSMRRGRTHVISLFNAFRIRKRGDLYLDRLAGAIEQAGGDFGYDILVHSNFKRAVKETYEFLNGGFSDGLILFGATADEPLLPLLRKSSLPTVLIGPRHSDPTLSAVMDDEAMGMRLVAEALLENGHTEIAAIVEQAGGVVDPTGRLRRLREELAARGVALRDQNVIVWNDSAPEAVQKLAALSPRPTALFVWHDRNAYHMVEACEAHGIRVPQDLSVVGYDGIVWPSTSPHIVATVEVPVDEMAEKGVALLDRLIQGELGPKSITLPVRFLPGTTLGPNPSNQIQRRTHS
jgi:DNA-binding LacI/PurR family transcriptional regulator